MDSHDFHVKQAKKRLSERDKNFKKKLKKLNKYLKFSGQRNIK